MENNFKHTPGPWVVGSANYNTNPEGVHGGDFVICDMCPDGFEGDEYEANKKLITAAPELLEACIKALDNLHNGEANTKYRLMEVLQTLEEAIKKATE